MHWISSSDRTYLFKLSLLLLSIIGLVPMVPAQEPPTATAQTEEVAEVIKQLRKQVAELEARTRELEARLGRGTPEPAAPAAEPVPAGESEVVTLPEVDSVQDHVGHGGGGLSTPLLQIRGFSDLNYRASTVKGQTNSFAMGQMDLFFNSRLSDKMNVLAEAVFEADEENELEFDLERIMLQYAVNDYFNFGIGRYHTAIGYYNTAFHHGTWFQTATGRPFLFAFEDDGGILPIHNVGVTINGRIPSGKLGLNYVAELGNGRASRSKLSEAVQIANDENNGKSFNLGIRSRPPSIPGLQVGFNVYRDRLTPDGQPRIGQTIWAAHAVYQTPSFEFLNEGVLVRHAISGTNQTINTPAFYTQISQRFLNRWRPYLRYQYINVPDRDPILNDIGRRHGPSLGIRYDLGEFAALKFQYDRTAVRAQRARDAFQLQFAFTF
ncbi:MAG TPA: hypothetical protein VJ302_30300 [Blastocatellia bacterium]|nr:hypothetical protein [Blastocatellia bacterium]